MWQEGLPCAHAMTIILLALILSQCQSNMHAIHTEYLQHSTLTQLLSYSNGRTERDVKQKRQLIDDLRTKLKQEKEKSCRLEEKVVR